MKHVLRWGYHPQYECEIESKKENEVQLDRHLGILVLARSQRKRHLSVAFYPRRKIQYIRVPACTYVSQTVPGPRLQLGNRGCVEKSATGHTVNSQICYIPTETV